MKELPRIQDDLYEAVNGEWLETAVIPDDKPYTGGFATLDENVEKLLIEDFKAFAEGKKATDVPAMGEAIKLFRKILDAERRQKEGISPVLPLLEKIKGIQTFADFNRELKELYFLGAALPFQCGVTVDMADATKHCFILAGPDIILPDTTYYAEDNPAKAQLLQVYGQMAGAILGYAPLSKEEAEQFLKDTLAIDELMAKSVKSQLEWADYVKNHNPEPAEEVQKQLGPVDFSGFLKGLLGDKAPGTIVVYDPRAIAEFQNYVNEETLPALVHWIYVKTLIGATSFLSPELKSLGTTYRRALYGIAKEPEPIKDAYRTVSRVYAEPIGVYYGRTYFGEEAKKDVVGIVKSIIATYKERIKQNPILSPSTKDKAILKLSTIEIKMGYPDDVHDIFKKMVVDEKDSLFETMKKISAIIEQDQLDKIDQPVDRTEWGMPGHMVNASYNPSMNDITFPAAILQKPFYSLAQSREENLGGIGAVIGHEISHAFDNNGASFDENGNLASWWTKDDYAAFKKKTEEMIAQWDGIPFHGGKVNGELVVSENIADNGGLAVTLQIMSTLEKPDYQKYFINWAKVWCQKAKEEYINLLLVQDVHSPAKLRANVAPRNFKEWYEAFDVKPTDEMYIPPEKRVVIW